VGRIEAWPVVTTAQVAALSSDPSRLLVDARAAERYSGSLEPIDTVAGHIPGAENHPFSSNLAADGRFLSAPQLRQRWQLRLRARQPSAVVAMCGSGVTACHNLLALEIAGLPGAQLYAGSWSEWIRDSNRPIARGDGSLS
jgi:thiosulfate/3-mercaptopyruvate sulfurtransferase